MSRHRLRTEEKATRGSFHFKRWNPIPLSCGGFDILLLRQSQSKVTSFRPPSDYVISSLRITVGRKENKENVYNLNIHSKVKIFDFGVKKIFILLVRVEIY